MLTFDFKFLNKVSVAVLVLFSFFWFMKIRLGKQESSILAKKIADL